MFQLHVAPSGDDSWPGTIERPLATLERAREAAREVSGGAVVNLRGGLHVLDRPFELTEADSGTVYQAYGGEEAVISGGRRITGWRERDGVWLAEVGDLETRQLTVDGRRASRAARDGLPGTAVQTETGYVTDAPLGWRSPGDVEFVYRGVYPWTEARLPVASVSDEGGSITMAQPGFGLAMNLYDYSWQGMPARGPGLPTRIENDASFLTEPGTFVLDRSRPGDHVLLYLPRPGEDPARTHVVAPVLETLVRVTGARDVAFRQLVFADATWLRPGRPAGFPHYHGNGFYEGGDVEKAMLDDGFVTYPASSVTIPACVTFEDTTGAVVEGCRFTRLGASGLGITGGEGLTVRGCGFDTLSAGAIVVSGSRETTVEDNRIREVGLEFSGSPGISVTGTHGCVIARNEVADVPHCGIVAGPGRGTRILRNLTSNTMKALADGGGVYLSGPQGDSAADGAVVRGNVIRDTLTPYNFGLYTDYGASWVTLEENVVLRADNTAVLHVAPPLENVVYRRNFWDADPLGHDDPPAGVTYEGNVTIKDERELNATTAHLQSQAGPRA
ncbi:right-handed parallel beta-helix repeat-containing protein [Nonomuraea terrae]|uniref:Right-handed parallel beta-helix repeat-containing protein n=1 Tax=Nonomuraea terrae TaxID=2530383 RepID=A0A4R4XUC2_9ACTN|nr:right-handed parallel beta-helix repeat-containing protein [Nonomuraea terrae]TDD35218.1 right-handed parallel beta-helix repeat-containing protein [Nonomuraea terrae]